MLTGSWKMARLLWLFIVFCFLAGCRRGDWSLPVALPAMVMPQGTAGTTRITVARTGDFRGEIAFSISGLPAGATAEFAPARIANAQKETVLTLAVESTVTAGTHTLRVVATDGKRTKEVALTVVVQVGQDPFQTKAEGLPIEQATECTVSVEAGESLQKKIDGAAEGAIVCIKAGVWRENLVTSKSVTLRGSGATVTVLQGAVEGRPVLQIGGDAHAAVNVENLTVRNARGKSTDCVSVYPAAPVTVCPDGVAIHGRFEVTLRNLHVVDKGRMGIYVTDYARVSITNCRVSGSGRIGLFVRRYAVAVVEGVIIQRNNEGVNIADSAEVSLSDSRVEGSTSYGILAGGQPAVSLQRCTIAENGRNGLVLWYSPRVSLISCLISNNQGWGIVKMSPYSGVLTVDPETQMRDNERSGIGSL